MLVYRYVLSTLPALITSVLVSLVMLRHVYGPRSHANLDTSVVGVLGTYQPVCACQSAQSKYPLSHERGQQRIFASLSLTHTDVICMLYSQLACRSQQLACMYADMLLVPNGRMIMHCCLVVYRYPTHIDISRLAGRYQRELA